MKRNLTVCILAVFTLSLVAGDGPTKKKKKYKEQTCSMSAQACLDKLTTKLSKVAWDGIYVEGVGTAEVSVKKLGEDSPAAAAGMKVGDVLASANGVSFANMSKEAFWKANNTLAVGDEVTYAVVRDGKKLNISMTMTSLPKSISVKKIGWHMMAAHAHKSNTAVASN